MKFSKVLSELPSVPNDSLEIPMENKLPDVPTHLPTKQQEGKVMALV